MYNKICPNCNSEFITDMSFKKYCSDGCTKEFNKKKSHEKRSAKRKIAWEQMEHSKECDVCGERFELTQQHRNAKYCSKKCRKKAERVLGSKRDTDLKYKDKVRFDGNREKALQRDDYKCVMCDKKSDLIVHHIDCSGQTDSPNNELDNLTTLCRKCHINLHKILDKK